MVCLVSCLMGWSQTQHFYTADKLSSNQITGITQDGAGYIWIGTEYGLNKYDGYSFSHYLHKEGNDHTIQSNNIATLFTDREGNLWAGSGMGLSRYNAANNNFDRVKLPGIQSARVNDIIQPSGDHLLVGTAGYGLYQVNVHTLEAKKLDDYAQEAENSYFSQDLLLSKMDR